jgi:CheY-like chemotaxis protein
LYNMMPKGEADRSRARPPRGRLMVVEDDFVLRTHLAELLTSEGFEVACAADGAEALWRLEREPTPTAILLDIVLPRMDGVSFRQEQLRSPELRAIPTIAVTATRDRPELESLEFHAVIRKPTSVDQLLALLADLGPNN